MIHENFSLDSLISFFFFNLDQFYYLRNIETTDFHNPGNNLVTKDSSILLDREKNNMSRKLREKLFMPL